MESEGSVSKTQRIPIVSQMGRIHPLYTLRKTLALFFHTSHAEIL